MKLSHKTSYNYRAFAFGFRILYCAFREWLNAVIAPGAITAANYLFWDTSLDTDTDSEYNTIIERGDYNG